MVDEETDEEWFRRCVGVAYSFEKRGNNQYLVLDACGKTIARFQRQYEAESYIAQRVGRELRSIERRIETAARRIAEELLDDRATRFPLDSPPLWEGSLYTELLGHAVYRVLSRDGEVLYVGVTNSLFNRMSDHRALAPWWPHAATVDWVVYDDREEALRAESAAIRLHRPRGNTLGLGTGAR